MTGVQTCALPIFGKVGYAQIGPLGVAATIVTDSPADADLAWLTDAGLDVVVA